ncbi:hypothetical protein Hte_009770 [Hypoxylon texense]
MALLRAMPLLFVTFVTLVLHQFGALQDMHLLETFRSLVFSMSPVLVSGQVLLSQGWQHPGLSPRADSPNSVALQYLDSLDEYTLHVKIGTPGQPVTMAIEFMYTASYGTMIESANTTRCMNPKDIGSGSDPSLSLPVLHLLGGTATDTIGLVEAMETAGHSVTRAFSLWLQEGDDYTGGLLFGAIDTNRYKGDLVSLESYVYKQDVIGSLSSSLLQEEEVETAPVYIAMTSLSVSSSTGTDDIWVQKPMPCRINIGTAPGRTFSLPIKVLTQIWILSGVSFYTKDRKYSVIPCSMRDSGGYFTFGFGGSEGLKVNVSMRSLVTPLPKNVQADVDSNEENLCEFKIYEAADPSEPFDIDSHLLRSVYTVVDLYNHKVAMAPLKLDAKEDESNIVMFSGKSAPIPSATLAPNQPPIMSWTGDSLTPPLPISWNAMEGFKVLTATTTSAVSSLSPSSSSSSSSGTNNTDVVRGGLNTGTKAGMGIGVSIASIMLSAGAFLGWGRWKRKRELAIKLLIEQQLRRQKPELHGTPLSVYEARGLRDSKGNPVVAEMPGYPEPAELHVVERSVELPATPVAVGGGERCSQGRTSASGESVPSGRVQSILASLRSISTVLLG